MTAMVTPADRWCVPAGNSRQLVNRADLPTASAAELAHSSRRLWSTREFVADGRLKRLDVYSTSTEKHVLRQATAKQATTAMRLAAQLVELQKHYHLGEHVVRALRGVNADFPEGDYVAIMGSSGSGKSTMLNILGALDRPTSGSYYLAGADVSQMGDDELSEVRNRRIGFIFQSYNLIPQYTVLENIQVPLHYRSAARRITTADQQRCADLAARVGLNERLDHRPFQLSGGQQQRVAIARALVNDPEIILADEPTGNLDSVTEKEIMQLLSQLNREGRTIIIVTHETSVARQAKRQIIMKDGLIAGDGMLMTESGK
jgi:putative ABC transport system ATP-binding protein